MTGKLIEFPQGGRGTPHVKLDEPGIVLILPIVRIERGRVYDDSGPEMMFWNCRCVMTPITDAEAW